LSSGEISVGDLVFLDEAGAKLGMSNDYSRAEGGERAIVKEPKNQGKNISMVGALGINGIVAMMYCLCTVDAMGFSTFIDHYLVPNLRPGQIVIMDNVNFHKTAQVKLAIENAGASLVFLPAYSPELNPIEQLWSKVKTYLKSKIPKTLEDFHDSFVDALSTVTENDCEGWFGNSGVIQ
jgi:transposase